MKIQLALMEITDKEKDAVVEIFSQVSEFKIGENIYGTKEASCDFRIPVEGAEISVELGADEEFSSVNFRVLVDNESYHFGMISSGGRTAYFQLRCLEKYVMEMNIFS